MEYAKLMTFLPAEADQILKTKNPYNRPLSKEHVDFLASEMKRGNFKFNGDPIRFDINGNLMDGQHRLKASVKSGVPLVAVVINNLAPEAMDTIDCGKKRSLTDKLKMHRIANAALIGSATRARMAYFSGDFGIHQHYSDIDAIAMLTEDQCKIMDEAGKLAKRVYHSPLHIYPSAFAGLVSICLEHDEQKTKETIDKLASGAMLDVGDPCLAYRKAVAKAASNKHTQKAKRTFVALTIAFFNAVFSGKKVKTFSTSNIDLEKPLFFAPIEGSASCPAK